MLKAITTFRKTDEKLQIHRIVKLLIEPVAFLEDPTSKERRSRWDVQDTVVEKNECAKLNLPPCLKHSTHLINDQVVAIENVNFRIVFKRLDDMLKTTGPVAIIGIQPADNFALRPPKSFI